MRCCLTIVVAWLILVSPVRANNAADRIDIVIARGEQAVELFLAMPTDLAVSHFGLSREDLIDKDGFADFQRFSRGTFDLGEAFWREVEVQMSGEALEFEAMSLMVHPADRLLPFGTPLDALRSIEVCGTTAQNVTLSDTHLYVGLIAYPKETQSNLAFELPNALPPSVDVSVRDFMDHRLASARVLQTSESPGVSKVQVVAVSDPSLSGLPLLSVIALLVFLAYVGTRGNGPYLTS